MKIHDLVIFDNNPYNLYVILKIKGEEAKIALLEMTGAIDNKSIVMPLSSLELPRIVSPVWKAAHVVYKQNVLMNTNDESKIRKIIKIIAEKNGLSPKTLHKMLKELESLDAIKYLK